MLGGVQPINQGWFMYDDHTKEYQDTNIPDSPPAKEKKDEPPQEEFFLTEDALMGLFSFSFVYRDNNPLPVRHFGKPLDTSDFHIEDFYPLKKC